jgi:hypothetical protein
MKMLPETIPADLEITVPRISDMMIEIDTLRSVPEHAVDHHTEQAEVESGMDMADSPGGVEIATMDVQTWVGPAHMDMET